MLFLAVFLPTLPCLALAKAPITTREDTELVPHNYIVVLQPELSTSVAKGYIRSMSLATSKSRNATGFQGVVRTYGDDLDGINAFHVECDSQALDRIREHPSVEAVYQDGYVQGQSPVTKIASRADQIPGVTWGLGRISHHDAGIANYEQPPQTRLYVLDTGIRITHQEFGGRAVWGANFIQGAPNSDDAGHGTHIAATAAGNSVGVDNSTIPVAVKCLDKDSSGTWSGIMAAVDWAVTDAKGRRQITRSVINMSIGGPTFQPLDDMVASASAAGMTVVVAASNYGEDVAEYSPARAPSAITVAAIDRSDTRPAWSNYGQGVALFAPGVDIASAWPSSDSSYATLSGTSMASPHIAGLATYLMSREGLAGPAAVKQRMLELATRDLVRDPKDSPNLIAFNGGRGA